MSTVAATTETSTETTILILTTVKATTTPTSISTTTPIATSTTSSTSPPSIKAITPSTTTTAIRNVVKEKRDIYLKLFIFFL